MIVSTLWGCLGASEPSALPSPEPLSRATPALSPKGPNFLIFVADDVGTDKIGAYREAETAPVTPHIDALANRGVLFRNAYTYPVCSASRSALLTGRYGRRTGMGGVIELKQSHYELPLDEITIPEALNLGGKAVGKSWEAVAIGKWHLSGFDTESSFLHPLLQGFAHHRGTIGNLINTSRDYGTRGNYYHYERAVDGVPSWSTTYATTQSADDAIEALSTMTSPWFLWVAFNAAHEPFDPPPPGLARTDTIAEDPDSRREIAIIEAMDHEIGRIIASMEPEDTAVTTIIFIGDNGTPKEAILPPFEPSHGKATLFEGGTNVPLIVAGPPVKRPGRESVALVSAVDLFPTLLALAEIPLPAGLVLDGTSFLPLLVDPTAPGARQFVFTERFSPIGPGPYEMDQSAVRDERYKLVRNKNNKLFFYDLAGRFDDGPGLPPQALTGEQHGHFERLRSELERVMLEARFAH